MNVPDEHDTPDPTTAADGGDPNTRGQGSIPPDRHRTPDDRQAQRRERRWLLWYSLIIVGAGVVVGVALALVTGDGDSGAGPGTWALLIGILLGVLGLGTAMGAGFVVWRRWRGSSLFARSPLWELPTQKQRRVLVRALRRGQPIDPAHRDLALRVALDTIRRRGLVWVYVAGAALQALNTVIQDGWERWLSVGNSLLFLGLAGYFAWLVHRMRLAVRRLENPA